MLLDPSSTHFSSRGVGNTPLTLHKMDKIFAEEAQGAKSAVKSDVDAQEEAKDVGRGFSQTGQSPRGGAASSSAATAVGDDDNAGSKEGGDSAKAAASGVQDAGVKKEASSSARPAHPKERMRAGDNSSDEDDDKVFDTVLRRQAEKTGLPMHAVASKSPLPAGTGAAAAHGKANAARANSETASAGKPAESVSAESIPRGTAGSTLNTSAPTLATSEDSNGQGLLLSTSPLSSPLLSPLIQQPKPSTETARAMAKDHLPKQSSNDTGYKSSPSHVPYSARLDAEPEPVHVNGHGGSASDIADLRKSANGASPDSSSQSYLQKSEEPKKGLGLQSLQNLWDDDEAEAAKKSPKMTIEERGARLRVSDQSRSAASRTSSTSTMTSQRSSALALPAPGGVGGPGGSVGGGAWTGMSSGSGSLSGGEGGGAETPLSMLSQLNLSVVTPPQKWRVDKVGVDGALGVQDWQAKAQALERQLAQVLERERRAAEERQREKEEEQKDGDGDSASAVSNEKVPWAHREQMKRMKNKVAQLEEQVHEQELALTSMEEERARMSQHSEDDASMLRRKAAADSRSHTSVCVCVCVCFFVCCDVGIACGIIMTCGVGVWRCV